MEAICDSTNLTALDEATEQQYDGTVARLRNAVESWTRAKRSIESQHADELERLAAQVQEASPVGASKMRELAQKLRNDGIESFSRE